MSSNCSYEKYLTKILLKYNKNLQQNHIKYKKKKYLKTV